MYHLNPSGNALVYSNYLGDGYEDSAYAVAVDNSGNAFVTGETYYIAEGCTGVVITASNAGTLREPGLDEKNLAGGSNCGRMLEWYRGLCGCGL